MSELARDGEVTHTVEVYLNAESEIILSCEDLYEGEEAHSTLSLADCDRLVQEIRAAVQSVADKASALSLRLK